MTFFVAGATFGDVGESLSTARAPFVDFGVLLFVTSVVFDDFGVTLFVVGAAFGQISGRAPEREMLYFSMQDALVVLCSTE